MTKNWIILSETKKNQPDQLLTGCISCLKDTLYLKLDNEELVELCQTDKLKPYLHSRVTLKGTFEQNNSTKNRRFLPHSVAVEDDEDGKSYTEEEEEEWDDYEADMDDIIKPQHLTNSYFDVSQILSAKLTKRRSKGSSSIGTLANDKDAIFGGKSMDTACSYKEDF